MPTEQTITGTLLLITFVILPVVLVLSWVTVRFTGSRRVPRAYWVFSTAVVGACATVAILVLFMNGSAPRAEDGDMGGGMLALAAGVNTILGAFVLAVLACLPQGSSRIERAPDPNGTSQRYRSARPRD